ncbi:MAG TPA: DUF72 domain-containing protein [Longimicrobium sp.]|jgi:uncharacterized protein YecE (DUF72 family)|uniref:DUF72 domain-containing protein n=1 Tax=Longimicrobium sp. TaxID=2029185 RepID=UPI002EDAD1F3
MRAEAPGAQPAPLTRCVVGCAGWTLPRDVQPAFPTEGTHLQRYAGRFDAVEINSSFHRPHRPSTYARWAESVPPGFRFCAKLPKTITHQLKLVDADEALDTFLAEAAGLGAGLACLLVQLPPSLQYDAGTAERFFAALRARTDVSLVCEPRHATWFTADAGDLLARWKVARVAADPARVPEAAEPGGCRDLAYYRLHGSPRIYYSAYDADYLDALAARIRADWEAGREVWCIFDNTASGAATQNALDLLARLDDGLTMKTD